jgi:tripartite-type tricarboxylate transporter receptor subunit TctC
MRRAVLTVTIVVAVTSWGMARLALAETFPSRMVKITAPYSGGAAPATFTRVVADKLSKMWSQPVIVEPRPGASGFIAIEAVKNAVPDGHEQIGRASCRERV